MKNNLLKEVKFSQGTCSKVHKEEEGLTDTLAQFPRKLL